jgi:hypothetical protein
MPRLLIQLTKRPDGSAGLRCTRADGSVTWQRQEGRYAAFFPLHDLTHYAIETELGYTRGFFGLIVEGWSIEEMTGKSPRGPLPREAIEVEHLVGLFDLERTSGTPWTADELHAHARAYATDARLPPPREHGDDQLERVRRRLRDLLDLWLALGPGQTLELQFD